MSKETHPQIEEQKYSSPAEEYIFWYKLLSSLQVTIIQEQVCLDLFQFFAGDNHTKQIKISFQSHVKREAACSHLHRLERDGRM